MNWQDRIRNLLEEDVKKDIVKGCSALVIKDGEEQCYEQVGYADAEAGKAFSRDNIIRLFSMTKPITSAAVMICVDRALIDLTEPVSTYLPEFSDMQVLEQDGSLRPARTVMKVKDLMNMTSGIPDGENWEGCSLAGRKMQDLFDRLLDGLNQGERISTRDMVREIAKQPLAFDPGEKWMYGLSADVLAAIVEVVTGERFGAFLKREIFDRLQMPDTGFYVPGDKRGRFARSYEHPWKGTGPDWSEIFLAEGSHLMEWYEEDVAYEAGGCGLVSTIDDYSHFAQMLVNDGIYKGQRILSSATVQAMRQNRLTPEQTSALDWGSNQGYGYGNLMRVLVDQGKAGTSAPLGEFGWDGWTGNYVCMDPVNHLVILYFTQLRGGGGILPITRKIRQIVYGAIDSM